MLKRILLYIGVCMALPAVYGQQDPEFSQYGSVIQYFNPGSVGSRDRVCLNAAYRDQWSGFPGAPSTSFFSADAAFGFLGAEHGAGISILNDDYGFNNDLGLNLAYAYRMELGKGKIGIGLNLGFLNKGLKIPDDGWVTPGESADAGGDPNIPQNSESRLGFDMGLGVFYRSENLFFGISTTHLNQARIKYEDSTPYLVRHYYATAGYTLQMSNPLFEVMPYFVLKSDGKANQLYLSTSVRYNKKVWGGVSFRPGDALVGQVGFELFNGVRIGYSYDFTTSRIAKYSSGSHELTLGYCLDLSLDRTPQKYKSVRFL